MHLTTGHDFFPLDQIISHPVTQYFRKLVQFFRMSGADTLTRMPGFDTTPVQVGFVVYKVTLGEIFLEVFRLSSVRIIAPVVHTQCIRSFIQCSPKI
jgi:hypothetical protein